MINQFVRILKLKNKDINSWYNAKLENSNRCFYSSVDLRYSGYKLVPVDTNLFPAGFNNLAANNIVVASKLSQNYLQENFPTAKKILIISEDHSRNLYYLDNLKAIKQILILAGYDCQIGSLTITENSVSQGFQYHNIVINSLVKRSNQLQTIDGFLPDLVLLNNDLMNGVSDKLQSLDQPIIPHPDNGWFKRRKSHHFTIYNQLVDELSSLFELPKFFLTADFAVSEKMNFKSKQGLEELAGNVEMMLNNLQEQYVNNNIADEPYVVIKSDYGTYGMGIMIAKSAAQVFQLNKKLRQQMHVTKNNIVNERVIIQEGIKTIDRVNGDSAEPMLYFIDHQLAGFLYRTHNIKDEYSNLNSTGMKINNVHQPDSQNYEEACTFVARLATLAAALES